MSAPVNLQISGLTVREGGKLAAGYSNTTNNIYNEQPKLLPYSTKAAFNASGKDEDLCLPDTRVDILNQIRAWIDGCDRSNIFWLSGWAGTGKSIIARTISREYYDKGRQGANFFASFFFSRGEEDINDASKFVTTIAGQLAKFPVLRERIHKAALDDDEIANKILQDQWKQLVIEAISNLDSEPIRTTLVLVIDALDECDKQGDIWRVLQLLATAGTLQTIQLRVLITSRPETDIRNGFSQFLPGVYQEFILHDISNSIVDHDIFIFFSNKFRHTFSKDWPEEQAIKRLVQKAAGLFIWAATAYRFIYEGRKSISVAKKRLHHILQSDGSITEPEDKLNKIYITVLQNAIDPAYNEEEKEIVYGMLREILGSIIFLFSSLSVNSLANLINLAKEELRQTLENLHSILDVPAKQGFPVRLHHPSFRDFFLDTQRCTDRQLQVDGNKIHWTLANSCIRIMSNMLKIDICKLHLPGALASDVDGIQIEEFIPEELQYACSYWVQHLQESKSLLLDNSKVHLFLCKHLLCWLEALSLLRKISVGINALISLENLVEANTSPSLHAFIHDAKRFSLNFRYIIEKAPLQIYSSALLFAPEISLVRKEFQVQMPDWITSVIGRQKHWSQVLQTLEGHLGLVNDAVFSPDGKLVASASADMTVRLWDSSTGATLQILKGHLNSVNAVAFSPDGKLVASASDDGTVRLWDSSTGATLQTLEGYSDQVLSVVFSPDGKFLASASINKTVRLWDSSTGAMLQTTEGHSGWVKDLAVSPDGKLVAFPSDNNTVRLWDSSTGATLQILEGHSDWVQAVAFSPDGMHVASASNDKTVRLWESYTGATLKMLEGHTDWVIAVAFSTDGILVASASHDKTVRIWDSCTGATLQTLEGYSGLATLTDVNGVRFSPDGKLVAFVSWDETIKIWDSFTGAMLQTLEGYSDSVKAITFSPDGKLVASANDKTVRLWELSTGVTLQTQEGHSGWVMAVVFSPDGKLVASASADMTVRLWDSSTGAMLQTLDGHSDWVRAVAFSPDGKLVASASTDKTARLWDLSIGATLQTLEGHSDRVNSVAFSPDGKLVALASDDNTVTLWDSTTGATVQTLKGHSQSVTTAVFSPDSKLVASASWDYTIKLWDSSTGATLQTLEGHSDWVRSIAFSPDGKLLASASRDKTARVWDTSSGVLFHTFFAPRSVSRLCFAPDGSYVESDQGFLFNLPPYSPHQPAKIFVIRQDRWIVGTIGNLLWLPPDYRASCSGVRNTSIVLGHPTGGVSFIHFDLSRL